MNLGFARRFKLIFVCCLFLLFPLQLNAQDTESFAGIWKASAETDEGERNHVMTIRKSNGKLSGSIQQEDKQTELRNVEVADGKLTFDFDMESQGTEVLIKIEYTKDGDKLEGTWRAHVDGAEAANGAVTAERKSSAAKFAGAWNAVATLPSGDELESVLELAGDNNKLRGVMSGETDTDIRKITAKGKSLRMAFELDIQGTARDVVIECALDSPDTLTGSWVLLDDNGGEEATGDWKATRDSAAKPSAKKTETAGETKVLFDGTSFDNFRGYAKEEIGPGWKIVDGALYLDGTKSGDIITKQEYGSFELEFEWKISEGGNSGVIYRASLGDNQPYISGPEYQVLDDEKHKDSGPTTSSGSLYALYPPVNKTLKPVGEWNTGKIVLNGNKIEHWLNGDKVVSTELGSDEWNQKVENSKFKKWEKFGKNKKGHISFQDHGNPVWYRNIKIKSLD